MATSFSFYNLTANSSCPCKIGDTDLGTIITDGFLLVLASATVLTNLLFMLTIYFNRPLHTYTNQLLVSNAAVDLLVGLFGMPLHILKSLQGNCWQGGVNFCHFTQAMDIHLTTVSIFHLTGVAAERYFRIVRVYWYERWIKRLISPMIVLFWVLPAPSTFAPILGGFHQLNVFTRFVNGTFVNSRIYIEEWRNQCGKQNPSERYCRCAFWASADFTLGSTIFQFLLPSLVMIFFYARIFTVAYKQAKDMESLRVSVAMSSSLSVNSGESFSTDPGIPVITSMATRRGSRHALLFSKDIRVVRLCAVVFLLFLLLWTPYFVMMILEAYCVGANYQTDSQILTPTDAERKSQRDLARGFYTAVWLGFINSFLSPVLLFSLEKNYRNGFRLMLHRKFRRLAVCLKITDPRKRMSGLSVRRERSMSSATNADSAIDESPTGGGSRGRFFARQESTMSLS
ncbi:putative 5-hydroxytryptamine receptor 4 [Hypsibius exemplaris]|uniref:5-hydroxytryptamine receptor 4 n=1 Tax=Hypsibius exemplaris TaxID=2072580 RepID=A0A1W0W959_HYPEX|nr:putative 5-hydroxytryptamine receptor 4 [Hypsibius exemplaris]